MNPQPSTAGAGPTVRYSNYRFVVLAVVCGLNLVVQALWISYAPIIADAKAYFNVGDFAIGTLSMVFMIAFIPLSLPASWLIDVRGMRFSLATGGLLMSAGALTRG